MRFVAILVWALVVYRPASQAVDCTFARNPDEYLLRESRFRQALYQRTTQFKAPASRGAVTDPLPIPRRNFIDDQIFGKLAGMNVRPARLTTDEEFLRRIFFDLIGLPPTPNQIYTFVEDTSATKRDDVIDRLLASPEFTDRWTMWFGDLLQNAALPSNFLRQYEGRNSFHQWIRNAIAENKPIKDIAYEAMTQTGNNFNAGTGGANYALNGITPMGPIQDTYDTMLSKSATAFLGVSHYDCLLCHNGRGHLDQVSLWGSTATRVEAQKMAAFFSRVRMNKPTRPATDFYFESFDVSDATTGSYDLNTNYGNRPDRLPAGSVRTLTPEYRVTGAAPPSGAWRAAFAQNMLKDPMFARNFANRLWKQMFTLALAEPVDALDPARLDPAKPPPDPWTFQATHPELLEQLASALAGWNYDLRELLRLIAQSSAYQLSSRYDGEWKYDFIDLFARHYPRRLEGEEIHDALGQISGIAVSYRVNGWTDPATSALRLPEPVEPRSNGPAANFMNFFLRGNRDTQFREQSGSILQQLALMNDAFVRARIRITGNPGLQAVARIADNAGLVDRIFLLYLSRKPSEAERKTALVLLDGAGSAQARNDAIEDLAWACVNKVEFIFSW